MAIRPMLDEDGSPRSRTGCTRNLIERAADVMLKNGGGW